MGICRNCGRALCGDCLAIAEDAVACRGRCEQRVISIQRMIDAHPVGLRTSASLLRRAGVTTLSIGALFLILGGLIFYYSAPQDMGSKISGAFVLGLGAIFFI